jgi:hypothetical protein
MNYDTRTTNIDLSRGRLQFSLKCLSVQATRLSINHDSNKPANVESGLDKIWVVCQDFRYQHGSPRKIFGLRLNRVATNRIFTSRTDSMTRVVWWSGLGGLS